MKRKRTENEGFRGLSLAADLLLGEHPSHELRRFKVRATERAHRNGVKALIIVSLAAVEIISF